MNLISRIWTGAVAYVALVLGAGLSITFNVVDVTEQRGPLLDRWDVLTAVAFPVLVVLMVEMFVSRLWVGQDWPMQALRWAGTVAIGGIAMRVSWTHGHDFFVSRGQTADVANLGPLSIDLLAIMATALILSGRTRTAVSVDKPVDKLADKLADKPMDKPADTDMPGLVRPVIDPVHIPVSFSTTESGQDTADLSDYQDKMRALETVPDAIPDWMDPPVVPGRQATRTKVSESEAVISIKFWQAANPAMSGAEIDRHVAAGLGCSPKTIYRIRIANKLS
jgi:hypothetical protein